MNLWIVGFSNVHTQIGCGLLLPYFEIPAMREPKRRNEEKSRFRALFLVTIQQYYFPYLHPVTI